ncbi:hypothetical protein ZWY2020_001859 [Hordeum vulgare]|nr:hypothetical protein ZWY2020_001859 [Hordeum vulgare]
MILAAAIGSPSELKPLAYRSMDFEEFCAAAISPYQLEALDKWEEIAGTAFFSTLNRRATESYQSRSWHSRLLSPHPWAALAPRLFEDASVGSAGSPSWPPRQACLPRGRQLQLLSELVVDEVVRPLVPYAASVIHVRRLAFVDTLEPSARLCTRPCKPALGLLTSVVTTETLS